MTLTKAKAHTRELTNNQYSIVGKYRGSIIPTYFRHNVCGYVFRVKPMNFFHYIRRKDPVYRCHYCGLGINDVKVHCPRHHAIVIPKNQLQAFKLGFIQCPICQKLRILDPIYLPKKENSMITRNLGI